MARLQIHVLRRVCSFASSSFSAGKALNDGFSRSAVIDGFRGFVNQERRTWQRGDFVKYCASGVRTLTTGGEGGKPHHHATKVDGGKKYSVVQIDSDGSWRTVWRNAVELVSSLSLY